MNGREKIQSAFTQEGTPEIGAVIPYESIFIRDHWSSLSTKPWWIRILPDIDTQFKWRRDIAKILGQDWFDLPSGIPFNQQEELTIIEDNGVTFMVNQIDNSRTKLIPPQISGWTETDNASIHPVNPPNSPEEIDYWIQHWSVPGQELDRAQPNLPHEILADWGKEYFPMGYLNGPLWSCYYMWGFDGLMTRIIDSPELVTYAVSCFTKATLDQIRIYAQMGTLGLWLEDCMTDMVSPTHYHTLNFPYLRTITEAAHFYGLCTIHYFCGNPTGKWPDLLDTGADGLSLEESKKGFEIDIRDVIQKVNGRMVVLGNLDSVGVLEQAQETDLISEIKRQITAGKKNNYRFIMSLGSPVTPGTTLQRVQRYLEYSHSLGNSV